MTGDKSLLDPGKSPDGGNAAVNGLPSNEPLDDKLPLCCYNKHFSYAGSNMLAPIFYKL
jgi:hypothetical protein